MLPIRRALKPAVEWASPCPLAAVVSGAGATTSLVMGMGASKWLHCIISKASRLIALRVMHSLARFRANAMQKMHGPLNCNLSSDFDHPPGGNLEIVGGIVRRP